MTAILYLSSWATAPRMSLLVMPRFSVLRLNMNSSLLSPRGSTGTVETSCHSVLLLRHEAPAVTRVTVFYVTSTSVRTWIPSWWAGSFISNAAMLSCCQILIFRCSDGVVDIDVFTDPQCILFFWPRPLFSAVLHGSCRTCLHGDEPPRCRVALRD